jgi:hypothetical protein
MQTMGTMARLHDASNSPGTRGIVNIGRNVMDSSDFAPSICQKGSV